MPTNTAIVPAPTTSSEHVSTVSDGDASYQPNASPASAFPNPETRSRNKKYPHGFAGRRLLVTKVQMEILVVGRFPINFVTPISIHSQRHNTN